LKLLKTSGKQTSQTILLVHLGSLREYLLVRNYLNLFRKSSNYGNYKITLCGNILWKDLAETFDMEAFDDFLWIDKKRFKANLFYKYKILQSIYKKGFEIIIDTTSSREIFLDDLIVKTSGAKVKIGSLKFQTSQTKWKSKLITDKIYTQLISQFPDNIFEFYRNKEFFEKVLKEKIILTRPQLYTEHIKINLPTTKEFIVILPGTRDKKKRWLPEKFAFVIQTIINRTKFDIIIAGCAADKIIADKLCHCFNSNRVYDMTGKTTFPQLAKLISGAKILISNETSAIHFAASVGTPFVCISNGNHLGRFHPYPQEMDVKGKYLYPAQIEKKLNKPEGLKQKYRFESDSDINSISPGSVYKAFERFI